MFILNMETMLALSAAPLENNWQCTESRLNYQPDKAGAC